MKNGIFVKTDRQTDKWHWKIYLLWTLGGVFGGGITFPSAFFVLNDLND